ncbi:4Fe-4S double cluster binding domain-containing protein [Paenibacillus larvae]|uniref:4Fe-4S double cluster binding domain-containing protein n=1 Tax=Paenibacillus larvae TaxID=1464 RepID=UPI003465F6D6
MLKVRLERLEAFIRERVPEARMESMVDTGALVDRAVAERAGIGWTGKNCAIITPEYGSWVFLGDMITNIPFPADTSIMDQCGDCTICIDACPTGALVGPGQLNASRCISFLTQTKGLLRMNSRKRSETVSMDVTPVKWFVRIIRGKIGPIIRKCSQTLRRLNRCCNPF